MLSTLINAWKVPDLRKRMLYTLIMLLIFRAGSHIPIPNIDASIIKDYLKSGQLLGFFDIISGGAFRDFTIFAMSIIPYVNASIILQLLTIAIPSLEQLAKEGEEGRKKIAQYTRYGTVILALIQAIGLTFGLKGAIVNPSFINMTIIVLTLTAGTAFLMWLGEQITDKGIGNGISLIIFAGIIARIPSMIATTFKYVSGGTTSFLGGLGFWIAILLLIVSVVVMQEAQRRIPVQYAKRTVGRKVYGGQSTHIPLRLLQAGVIPIIFGLSIVGFPLQIAAFLPNTTFATIVNRYFNWNSFAYNLIDFILIILFTYFYTAIIFNPIEVADNMKQYGGFIPGIRPGKPTADYLTRIMYRITFVGGVFLALITVIPILIMSATGLNVAFGGTAILIAVGVAIDTIKQLEGQMLMRHYQGFLK
ncbi:protein translocase subunit secY/sec61 alpha [Caldanaerobius fijiensis DSM 17918]|uniref:Protein translocase subunit SecY n=1 Tax=Caldanaerobius fijiensis DSM 17918 TaxID=1121256 RepID=A0A1M4YT65_9THEO|nr:preprotein translocase subunit SecY [Caldanaerobius fijiensis]SHF08918.1 protein translocase subunit secY/sec61 alpha [Caldanaerobius fijiensis DSM 17918]